MWATIDFGGRMSGTHWWNNALVTGLIGAVVGGLIGGGFTLAGTNSANETARSTYLDQVRRDGDQRLRDVKRPVYDEFFLASRTLQGVYTARNQASCQLGRDIDYIGKPCPVTVATTQEARAAFDEASRKIELIGSDEAKVPAGELKKKFAAVPMTQGDVFRNLDPKVDVQSELDEFQRLYRVETQPDNV